MSGHRDYYNDHDKDVCAWLRALIRMGEIPDGDVDDRSILDVRPADLAGYRRVHFFAGIGGWAEALRLADWPDDLPVWTGSPPCQPFSAAGKQLGRDDARHLAPHFISLVRACRPGLLLGEQVASSEVFGKAASGARKRVAAAPQWAWVDDLSDRLEAARYAVGAVDFPSAGIGAPHIRQRTFFGAVDLERLADGARQRWDRRQDTPGPTRRGSIEASGHSSGLADQHQNGCGSCAGQRVHDAEHHAEPCGGAVGMVNRLGQRLEGHGGNGDGSHQPGRIDPDATGSVAEAGSISRLADEPRIGRREERENDRGLAFRVSTEGFGAGGCNSRTGSLAGFWADADWLFCRDGKWRPVESSVQRLADGVPADLVRSGAYVPAAYPLAKGGKEARRVMRLRGYGNAINPHAGAVFIRSFMEALEAAA